ncbi:MAG: class I SAM-dependent methyltransferase [Planctomycetota bacterium]
MFSSHDRADDNQGTGAGVQAARKVGVDPNRGGTIRATSQDCFASNSDTFDLIFVDGLHHHEQVIEDVRNALDVLRPGGVIVLHDCLPLSCVAQYREQSHFIWNGDVWKALVEIRTWPEVDTATCLIDHGLGIVVPRANYQRMLRTIDYDAGLRFAMSASS